MGECNVERKAIQERILKEAREQAKALPDAPVLFLGGDWHPGVVGIAASRIAEEFWRPTWLFQRGTEYGKGSARSIPGFDVTDAMTAAGSLFKKFGGHKYAGGFTFAPKNEAAIREALGAYAQNIRRAEPTMWESRIFYDCTLPTELANLELTDALNALKPFGNSFEEPKFRLDAEIAGVDFYYDKNKVERKHTAVSIRHPRYGSQKILFFNDVFDELVKAPRASFIVSASRNVFRGRVSLSLTGHDYGIDAPA
jgi:single-stranded-DNA-specific exonuclease